MALKLALPGLDPRGLALAKARFKAWWNGAEFDEAAAQAALEAVANDTDADADLFGESPEPLDPRLEALQRIWGAGRVGPGDASLEASALARINLSASGALAVFGPGLWGPVEALANAHPGDLRVFEWREETQSPLKQWVARAKIEKRVTLSAIDAETFTAPSEAFDALFACDGFTHADNHARLAMQFTRMLKPKATAWIETYCAEDGAAVAPGFASAFSEPHIRPATAIATALDESGLRVESNEDVTDAHVAAARAGFRQLAAALKAQAALDARAAQELAWETEAWRARFAYLGDRRLERRLFVVSRI